MESDKVPSPDDMYLGWRTHHCSSDVIDKVMDGAEVAVTLDEEVHPNEAVITSPGERVRYETPDGARYVAICMPAFSPDTVHRDA